MLRAELYIEDLSVSTELFTEAQIQQMDITLFGFGKGDKGDKGDQGIQGVQGYKGDKGDKGDTGNGIQSIVKTSTSGLIDTYTITFTDGTTTTFQVENGNGIYGIAKTSTSGLVDTYTITFTNGTTSTFQVTNGKDAEIDDTTTSTTKVWSSSKVSTELAAKATKSALNKLKPLIYAGL